MTRRNLIASSALAASFAPSGAAAKAARSIIEMRVAKLRNGSDNQMQRLGEFIGKAAVPALKRAGAGPVGAFASLIAEDSPFLLVVTSYPTLSAMESVAQKMAADKEYIEAARKFYSAPGLPFQRMECSLLRGFDSMPNIEVPPTEGRKTPRVFEIRTYESNTSLTLYRKMKMFDDGEIAIFRRTGLLPVFFGETIVGRDMPNLTYMVAFDDLATRENNWRTFANDPEWLKLRATPGLSDAEIVSNISNCLVRPMPFSDIK